MGAGQMTAHRGAGDPVAAAGGQSQRRLLDVARAWIADDPDPAGRAELEQLITAGADTDLAGRFATDLRFGTAGLRGPLGAGPSRMNVATVRRATAGLAAYLTASVPDAAIQGVVIGCDARHQSGRFADETARVLSGAGLRVLRLPGQLPTPLLAFAVRHLGCAAGVMITASHNPPQDNGYKVYLGHGAQIAPPADLEISAAIRAVGPVVEIALGDRGEQLGSEITAAYLDAIISALPSCAAHDIKVAYSPLHGVGGRVLLAAFEQAGFAPPHVVATQADPDPDFPTLPKPNPEEPGVLDLAIHEARTVGADLVLANDPDADRLAVAVPDDTEPSGWRILRGDEVGALLGDRLLRGDRDPGDCVVASTVVSSSLLGELARAAGAPYVETLTGFKWIMHDTAARTDLHFLFAYEEAIGYAVNAVVRDKDGISAALLVAGIAAEARLRGQTLAGRLDDISCRFGLYVTEQFHLELPGETGHRQIAEIMAGLRATPPPHLLGEAITEIDDLSTGIRHLADGEPHALELPHSDVLIWRAGARVRVVVRPSGTEPRLKIYLQLVVPSAQLDDLAASKREAAEHLIELRDELETLLESVALVT